MVRERVIFSTYARENKCKHIEKLTFSVDEVKPRIMVQKLLVSVFDKS